MEWLFFANRNMFPIVVTKPVTAVSKAITSKVTALLGELEQSLLELALHFLK
jgi:hypothetical protein